jgi:hypothetical protein
MIGCPRTSFRRRLLGRRVGKEDRLEEERQTCVNLVQVRPLAAPHLDPLVAGFGVIDIPMAL